jgi:signal transduction histidine kinase
MGNRLAWPRCASLRLRMVALTAGAVTAVLLVGGLLLSYGLRTVLIHDAVEAIQMRVRDLSLLAAQGHLPQPIPVVGNDGNVVQVVDRTRKVLAASTSIDGMPALDLPAVPPGHERVLKVDRLPINETGSFRVVAAGTLTPTGPATVYAAVPLEDIDDTVAAAATLGLAGLPLFVLALSAAMWVVVGRTLRPVDMIRREVDEIGEHHLARRVPEPPRSDEIGRLARTMNAMLDRLERSAERQRQFIGDAAHELRSPITSLRAQLETARDARRPVDWHEISGELLDETLRMQRLADQLLLLARTDTDVATRRASVDLDDLVDEVVRARPTSNGLVIDTSAVEPAQVHGDALQLKQVIRNLVDNAGRHARSLVTLSLARDKGEAVLLVDDDGPGIPEQRREEIFQRFTRLDDARDCDAGGAGLGLAIVRDVVAAHGGTVTVSTAPSGGARFSVRLPRAS